MQSVIEKIKELPRYDIELCRCVIGPHIEYYKAKDGQFVAWEDLENIINIEKDNDNDKN